MEEFDVMQFDASQLSVFNQTGASTKKNDNIYRPRPIDAKTDDHVYRAVVKPIWDPHDIKHSIVEQQTYTINDAQGWLTVVSSLTVNDKSCPMFTAWKKCHFATPGSDLYMQAETVENGGKGLFDKRFNRFITVQILEDDNHPEYVGQYMYMKLPKFIWDAMNVKMTPSPESKKASIPVMDFLFGRAIELEITPGPGKPGETRFSRETSYSATTISEDVVSCTNPDGSSLLTTEQQAVLDEYVADMRTVWSEKDLDRRAAKLQAINDKENTKQLRSFYKSIVEKIKSFCPDINADLGYKPWEPEVAARVQAWIDVVLDCKDPRAATATSENTAAPATSAAAPDDMFDLGGTVNSAPAATEDEDDLPF